MFSEILGMAVVILGMAVVIPAISKFKNYYQPL
jgi:hypothetical protein